MQPGGAQPIFSFTMRASRFALDNKVDKVIDAWCEVRVMRRALQEWGSTFQSYTYCQNTSINFLFSDVGVW